METPSSKIPNINTNKKQIIVVGAGAAGLYAASLLIEQGHEVTLLEASNRTGGRVWTKTNRFPYKLEMGAEFVHGKGTLFHKMAKKADKLHKEGNSSFLWRDELFSNRKIKKLQDAKQYFADYEEFYEGHHHYEGEDISLSSFLEQHDITPTRQPDAYRWYEAFAGALGTNLENLGMKALAVEAYRWEAGEQNYRMCVGFESLLEEWKEKTKPFLQLEKPVIMVRSFAEGVEIITKDFQNYRADAVLITVPLTQLKQNKIIFLPELSPKKQEAIDKIGMDNFAIKFFLNFSENFWSKKYNDGEETEYLVGMKAANEYWETVPYIKNPSTFGLTAFIMGDKAKYYTENGFSKGQILEKLIDELDKHFDGNASATILDFEYLDWAKVEYIEGAYSYASVGSHKLRKQLARPIEDKIFFAGEATHYNGHFATVHGALETAERAVEEIMETIKKV